MVAGSLGWQKAIRSAAPRRSRGSSIRAKRVAGRALAPGGARADSFFAPEGKPGARSTQRAGPGRSGPGASEPVRTPPDRRPRADAFRGGDRTLPSKSISQRCAKGQPRARREAVTQQRESIDWGSNHALLDEEEAAMTPYASDDEAAADAPGSAEADAAAEAERRATGRRGGRGDRRAKEEEERRRMRSSAS